MIPPQADAEFVAHMEQVLDLYQKPYDPDCPVVCMDEQPVQLVQETRPPMAATKNRPRRVDYEYERAGTAAVFLFSEPLAGWRQATARARRTKVDWALEVAGLLEGRYADCPKITLVCDHLNTHTKGAFYEVFEPARARELASSAESVGEFWFGQVAKCVIQSDFQCPGGAEPIRPFGDHSGLSVEAFDNATGELPPGSEPVQKQVAVRAQPCGQPPSSGRAASASSGCTSGRGTGRPSTATRSPTAIESPP